MIKHLAPLALLALTACGPMNEGGLGDQFIAAVKARTAGTATAAPAAPALPPEVMAAGPGNILLVTLTGKGAVAPLVRAGERDGTITWISPGKSTLTLANDVLVSSRGLGNDLMGANVDGVRDAIAAGTGTATRTHSFIDGLDQITLAEMTCTYTDAGREEVPLVAGPRSLRRVDEACAGNTLVFNNSYWLDRSGVVIRSKQAVSPAEGFMIAERL